MLTNGDDSCFSAAKRVEVDVGTLEWLVLPWLLTESTALFAAAAATSAATTTSASAGQQALAAGATHAAEVRRPQKRPREGRLRLTDPW